ncbi:RHS repeat-associated core domain-containing protein, partial [Xenorhabdus bovienii]|uniref:RHS repeat domain-containing protein n=1 Tax=Xenorhabdus bovienii TaxID=40576 RepID=UPI0031B57F8B
DGFRPQIWRYRWDTQNQLTHCETPDGSRWRYQYDAFGRRIRKRKVHDGKLTAANLQRWLAGKPDLAPRSNAIMGQEYLWSGDQLIEEVPVYADGTPVEDQRVRWLYEPGSLTPSARFEKGKLHYVVSDHQGTVREMFNENGTLVWAQRLTTWGKAEKSPVIASNDPDYHVGCNFRFLGQYEDGESGLYYNRFRYYNPDTGQYISPDPIGLLGGVNPYGYVHNPSRFIDPFGLAGDDCDNLVASLKKMPKNDPPKPHQIEAMNKAINDIYNGKGIPRISPKTKGQTIFELRPNDHISKQRWKGAREWAVVEGNNKMRILTIDLGNGKKKVGFTIDHYDRIFDVIVEQK